MWILDLNTSFRKTASASLDLSLRMANHKVRLQLPELERFDIVVSLVILHAVTLGSV